MRVFCGQQPKVIGKLIEMMQCVLPMRGSNIEIARVWDSYLACDFVIGQGRAFRT
jgi:hypothetical protein